MLATQKSIVCCLWWMACLLQSPSLMKVSPVAPIRSLNLEVTRWLRLVQKETKTGKLLAKSESSRRELFFRDGRIIGIRTTVEEERLGNILVRIGRITREHFDDASIFVRHGWRIGAILAELKILDGSEIDPMLRLQAMEVSCAILTARDVRISFEETGALFTTLGAALSISDVIMEATRRIEDASGVRRSLAADVRRFEPAGAPVVEECSNWTPEEVFVLSRFYGGATVDGVVETCGLDEGASARAILGLIECGSLIPVEGSERGQPAATADPLQAFRKEVDRMHRRLERLDPWRALNLPSDVGTATARAAFRDALRRYHPDRYHTVQDPDFQAKLATVCESFTNAFTCLTTALRMKAASAHESVIPLASTVMPASPTEAEDSLPESRQGELPTDTAAGSHPSSVPEAGEPPTDGRGVDPEICYRDGKLAMEHGDYWRAVQLLRIAIELCNDRAAYHFLLARALSKNPRWQQEAAKSYRRAMELEPYRPEYSEALARLYQSAGMDLRAEGLFRRMQEFGLAVEAESGTESFDQASVP